MSGAGAVPAAARGELGWEAAARGGQVVKIMMVITERKQGASGEGIRRVNSQGSALSVPRGEVMLQSYNSRGEPVFGSKPCSGHCSRPLCPGRESKPCKERKKPIDAL